MSHEAIDSSTPPNPDGDNNFDYSAEENIGTFRFDNEVQFEVDNAVIDECNDDPTGQKSESHKKFIGNQIQEILNYLNDLSETTTSGVNAQTLILQMLLFVHHRNSIDPKSDDYDVITMKLNKMYGSLPDEINYIENDGNDGSHKYNKKSLVGHYLSLNLTLDEISQSLGN